MLQPAADGIKLIFKEEVMPAGADKILFFLAPILTMIPAIVIVAVIPVGPDVELFGRIIRLGISDLNVGLLYILAIASVAAVLASAAAPVPAPAPSAPVAAAAGPPSTAAAVAAIAALYRVRK